MKIFIIIAIILLVIYFFLKKIKNKNKIKKYAENKFIPEIRNKLKFVISKLEINYLPKVDKLLESDPNPNKKEVFLELNLNGTLDKLIKQEIMSVYDNIIEIGKSIYALAVVTSNINESERKKNVSRNISITTDLQFDIMNELKNQELFQYNDNQVDDIIKQLTKKTKSKLLQ
jgi:hypothetical protein